jgi:hypothetical protein
MHARLPLLLCKAALAGASFAPVPLCAAAFIAA